jgi:tetratricopeptide (TPR) repeat protein
MTPDEDNKVLRSILVGSGMVLCLFLTGCGNRTAEPADQEGIAAKTERYDRTISEFNRVLEGNPQNARAYYERGLVYYNKGEYDKAWEDVHKAQSLGYQVPSEFLRLLSAASGREK